MNTTVAIQMENHFDYKILLRIILSPIIFVWGLILLMAVTVVPIFIILTIWSFIGIISQPFIWLFRKAGADIHYAEPFLGNSVECDDGWYSLLFHFLGLTIYIWGAFFVMFYYIITGEIITGE